MKRKKNCQHDNYSIYVERHICYQLTLDINHDINFIGLEIVGYESPRPRSGIHRLVLGLFRQPCRQTVVAPGWRQNFNTRDFAEFYNLGLPVAALYFNCQRENGSGGRRM